MSVGSVGAKLVNATLVAKKPINQEPVSQVARILVKGAENLGENLGIKSFLPENCLKTLEKRGFNLHLEVKVLSGEESLKLKRTMQEDDDFCSGFGELISHSFYSNSKKAQKRLENKAYQDEIRHESEKPPGERTIVKMALAEIKKDTIVQKMFDGVSVKSDNIVCVGPEVRKTCEEPVKGKTVYLKDFEEELEDFLE